MSELRVMREQIAIDFQATWKVMGEMNDRFSADIEATAVGHDLNRGTAAFRRVVTTDTPLMVNQRAAVG